MSAAARDGDGDRDRDLPLAAGAVAGASAWLLGYVVTYLATSSRIHRSILRQFAEVPTWKVVGWVFYNAHFVSTVFEGFFGGTANFVGGDGFTPLFFLLPFLLLLAAGVVVGRVADVADQDVANASLAGATLVLGYGPLSLVGAFAFGVENAHPDLVLSVFLAVLFYPLVVGGLGGVLASRL